ncbi:MAG: hypothetical protein HY514_01775 [Candidatus Aenigmarchaeota archaeon]|nr:hypothetical protein [Candidatus Aenigmarchaeota archaeon]
MRKFQAKLISLVHKKEITSRDAALIVLAKDGLKPLSCVGVFSSPRLISILREYEIPFAIKNGRIHIGRLAKKQKRDSQNGINFGFPVCCASVFLNSDDFFFSENSRHAFSFLSPYIFHIPCSGRCKETKKLAIKYMHHLKENYPRVANHIEKNIC